MLNQYLALNIGLNIALYIGGFFSGYFIRWFMEKDRGFGFKESNFVLVIITIVYAISVIVDLADTHYDTPLPLHALMGAIVGFFFKTKGGKE